MASIFTPPGSPAADFVEPELVLDEDDIEKEPEKKHTIGLDRHDWGWAAKTATESIDVASGWLIGRWSDLEPLEASESSREKFAKTLGTFGEQRFGAIEVPTWMVLVVCLIAMIVSKVIGAPKKAAQRASDLHVRPASLGSAKVVDSPDPDVASAAARSEKPQSPPPPKIVTTLVDDGSAQNAQIGF